jgi:hypothetical protein
VTEPVWLWPHPTMRSEREEMPGIRNTGMPTPTLMGSKRSVSDAILARSCHGDAREIADSTLRDTSGGPALGGCRTPPNGESQRRR